MMKLKQTNSLLSLEKISPPRKKKTQYWSENLRPIFFFFFLGFLEFPESIDPIPTGNGLNQPIYSYHMTQAGRNMVKMAHKRET